ncbi:hypothetical protein AGLY_005468 [Aphis glycines]|uniref:Dynein regulatory complex protein 9 n=1 Tax=Aphis glycines TaxID=307491 RepID=A0A6G0TVD1_APHGL|nr:hypothetical protein AGLY_005468 [Aphis glycines]
MVMTLIKQDVESNLSGDTALAANVIISCIIYTSIVFIVSLVIKILLRTCQDRLTFVSRADDAKYHLTSLSMEIVEITEQYCYTMNIGIILKLYILSGKMVVVILLKLICNYLIKLTTNSCSYYVFRTNLVFVVYHISPLAWSVVIKLRNYIIRPKRHRRRENTSSPPDDGHIITNNYKKTLRHIVKQDLYQGLNVLRSIVALIASSYISNSAVVRKRTEHQENVLKDPMHKKFKSEYSVQILYIILYRVDTLNAAIGEAIITFTYLAMQLGLRKVCKCFRVSKNLLTSFTLMYINMTAFKYTGVLMNPTYATALAYGCPGQINKDHFIIFWIGPIVGALIFKDVINIAQIIICVWYTQNKMELNENLGKLKSSSTIQENELLSEIFERTLLEISIMDSIYGSSIISEYVKDIFQVSIDELHNFGTLKTLHAIVDENEQQKKLQFRLQKDEREPSNDEQFIEEYESLEKKIQKLKQKEEEIDAIIEKCTADGEHKAIRRETEKNYVDKWEKSRVENFKFKFKSEELELQKYIIELQAKMKTDKVVDNENEQYLDYSIKELEKQIEYWECKYKTDTKEIDEKLENLIVTLEEKTKEIECLKKTFNERKTIIEEHAENKQRAEEEKKLIDHMEKMATKIQAWWRGTMVRRRLGPYKHLSGPRKKSIKKSLVNKTKKTKSK